MAFIQLLGAALIIEDVKRGATKARELEKPLRRAVSEVIIPSIQQNFEAGGRPAWEPLAERTIDQRQMIGRGVKILVDTGSLLEEMGLMKNWKIQGGNAELQTPDAAPYAGIHQEGTNQIPARPFAILQPEDEVAIEKVFDDWMRS